MPQKKRQYVTLDDLDVRQMAQNDPRLFIQTYKPPLIIDEVQYAPQLFSYIKIVVDREKKNGMFWLTGSQKFHLMKGITESLAGRVAIVDLLGFSNAEIEERQTAKPFIPDAKWINAARKNIKKPKQLDEIYKQIWQGSFPKLNVDKKTSTRQIFYSSYVQTYLQRDVKDILKISDETAFYNFLSAVAARTGSLLNYNDLARDVGIDNKTAKSWLSVLETSGLVYVLNSYHNNLSKRLVKAPKQEQYKTNNDKVFELLTLPLKKGSIKLKEEDFLGMNSVTETPFTTSGKLLRFRKNLAITVL